MFFYQIHQIIGICERIVNSYASDTITITKKGTFIAKQFVFAFGLYNITGQKKVSKTLNRI